MVEQFAEIDSTSLVRVKVRTPYFTEIDYLANPIDIIYCTDKSGSKVELTNKPSIEIRVTQNNGKKTIFYFDRILVNSTSIMGFQSRILSGIAQTIDLKDVQMIEIQDSKKAFTYISK